jgi:adenylate cyclase class 2
LAGIIDDSVGLTAGQDPIPALASTGSDHLEVEVKFLVDSLEVLRRRLAGSGAQLIAPRIHEQNVRFDTPSESLLRKWQLLRLRQDSRVRLTFKAPVAEDQHSEAKIREEIEVTIDDFDKMATILERLGFQPVQMYEKFRETYHWDNVEIVLDETPFGDFVELEGSESAIRAVASGLGLDWSRRILANYLALMELARQTFDLPFHDLTFVNFERHPVSMTGLLPVCLLSETEEW